MYEAFKKNLITEMETRRDLLVIREKRRLIEPIFEVSSEDDKLYNQILSEFDRIAVRNVEKLLYDLCVKYGLEAELSSEPEKFDLVLKLNDKITCIELRNQTLFGNRHAIIRLSDRVNKSNNPVCFVYLIKDGKASRDEIARETLTFQKYVDNSEFRIILFDDLMRELFGNEELKLFRKAMATYKEEMHQAIGYQITEIFTPHNLEKLKIELEDELLNFPYTGVKEKRYDERRETDSSYQDLRDQNFKQILDVYLNRKRYKLLMGNNDFAKSFLTSEWLYKKYVFMSEMDNTFIVSGYLKSIEQLLWDIIFIVGQGRQVRDVVISEENEEQIDRTLGSLEHFITNYSNDDLMESFFGGSTHFVMRYLRTQLSDWREKYRNGYFHKHVLEDKAKIEAIRDETFFLYMLILGTIALDDTSISLLS